MAGCHSQIPYLKLKDGSQDRMALSSTVLFKYSGAHVALHQATWEIHIEFPVFSYTLGSKFPMYSLRILLDISNIPPQPSETFLRP